MNPQIDQGFGRRNNGSDVPSSRKREAVHDARELLEQHTHFHGHAREITVEIMGERLILSGQLPSFYLKQLLQECLRNLDGVSEIDNRVDVVCCDGLSGSPREPK